MNRRSFLIYSGLSVIAIALGISRFASYIQEEKVNSRLADNLEMLFDTSLKGMAEGAELDVLLTTLRDKNVVSARNEINTSRVKELAQTDQAIQYNGWYYSQTEFELYGLAYLVHGRDI